MYYCWHQCPKDKIAFHFPQLPTIQKERMSISIHLVKYEDMNMKGLTGILFSVKILCPGLTKLHSKKPNEWGTNLNPDGITILLPLCNLKLLMRIHENLAREMNKRVYSYFKHCSGTKEFSFATNHLFGTRLDLPRSKPK